MSIKPKVIIKNRRTVHGGEHAHVKLDRQLHSRALHLGNVARECLGVPTNLSGTIRAALELLMDHADAELKKAACLEDGPKKDRIVSALSRLFVDATVDRPTPWQQYPEQEVRAALIGTMRSWTSFRELVRKYQRGAQQ